MNLLINPPLPLPGGDSWNSILLYCKFIDRLYLIYELQPNKLNHERSKISFINNWRRSSHVLTSRTVAHGIDERPLCKRPESGRTKPISHSGKLFGPVTTHGLYVPKGH